MLIAIEHLGIMVMEIWGRPEQQARAFDLPVEYTRQRPARISFANQGIYNGMLGILIIASTG
jgi:Predicted membrane protein